MSPVLRCNLCDRNTPYGLWRRGWDGRFASSHAAALLRESNRARKPVPSAGKAKGSMKEPFTFLAERVSAYVVSSEFR